MIIVVAVAVGGFAVRRGSHRFQCASRGCLLSGYDMVSNDVFSSLLIPPFFSS